MTTRKTLYALLVAGLVLLVGCPPPPPPGPVTLELVNQTTFDVRPNYYLSAEATSAESLFVNDNLQFDFTDRPFPELRPNETITLELACDQIASVGSQRPLLFDATTLTLTTSEDTVFAARGTDFECGQTVRLVFFREGDAFRVRIE